MTEPDSSPHSPSDSLPAAVKLDGHISSSPSSEPAGGSVAEAGHVVAKLSVERKLVEKLEAAPRWPAIVAVLAVGLLDNALPQTLRMGPPWMVFATVGVLLIPTVLTLHIGRHHLNQACGYTLNLVVTLTLCASLARLLIALPAHSVTPLQLFQSAAALWVSNILVFALWYWRLDAGGPHHRDARPGHPDGAFLFPQMTLDSEENWSPHFIDYLFLAFNTSTAFSPTDTAPLSRWAKGLMMLQALISLLILAVLGARAVNVL